MLTLPAGLPVFVAGLAVLPFVRWRRDTTRDSA